MGTHPIFESDFDCLTERINKYSFMNDVDNQIEQASKTTSELFEDGKLSSHEYQQVVEKIASAKAELDYYKTRFRRFDCSMDQAKIIELDQKFFEFDDKKSFPIWNLISDRVEDLYFQAKPILITSGLIKRRALEIAVEAKGDPKDLILLEIFRDGHDIRNAIFEVFLGKQSATAIILYEDIRNQISNNKFKLFVGYREIELKKLKMMKNSIETLMKGKTESLIPNRKAGIPKSSLIPSRNQKPQKLSAPSKKITQQAIPQRSTKKNNFSLKQLEVGISRKYGEKAEWMKESRENKKNDADLMIVETKEVPQQNYNELIYEENFPL